jgi:hypothetical protein
VSDNDRTLVPTFEYTSIQVYANRHHGGKLGPAYRDLQAQYRNIHAATTDRYLQLHSGVKAEDLGCQLYAGMGTRSSGPDDIYGAGFTRVRQSVSGSGTVIKSDGRSDPVSGDAVVDAEHFESSWEKPLSIDPREDPDFDPYRDVRRTPAGDHVETIRQQTIKAGGIDPTDGARPQIVDAAKTLQRTADAGRQLGSTDGLDLELIKISKAIRDNPQAAGQILKNYGLSRETYLQRVRDSVTDFGRKFPQ